MGNIYLLIIDGLGVGAQEDAADYGDEGHNTLGHVCATTRCRLPNFEKMGLGNIIPLDTVQPVKDPLAAWGKFREVSAGKDSTTGHWEFAGIRLDRPFPTYPDGFPDEVIEAFCDGIGPDEVLCNQPYSGTQVIADYGEEHMETGKPIVYTSADSVFQVACHVDTVPLEQLYDWCNFAREEVMTGRHGVGRVIARPFHGEPGDFERISDKRHDYSMKPPEPNLLSVLEQGGIKRYSIGKVIDLFAEQGFTQFRRTKSNAEGLSQLLSMMSAIEGGFAFINLIDTDQLYGHRLNPEGYAKSLQEIDRALPAMAEKMNEDDVLIITGDHGNDPTVESTDHSREFTPLLVYPRENAVTEELGIRKSFTDAAVSVVSRFGLDVPFDGDSFLKQ